MSRPLMINTSEAQATATAHMTDSFLYYPYSRHLRETFGTKTYKVVISSGLTCPTRDGSRLVDTDSLTGETLATPAPMKRGCAFCDVRGSSSYFGKQGRGKEIREQLEKRIPQIRARFTAEKFLAYFQSYTNTYTTDLAYLREIYTEALSHPDVSGLCIGTRPDCLPDDVINLLEEIAVERKTYISLELGVQSFEDPTLEWLVRGHSGQCSIDALERFARLAPHVHSCAHLIFGSPTDSPTTAQDAARILSRPDLNVRGVKLHQLMVLEHTDLAARYRAEPFPTLTLEAYATIVGDFLSHLSPHIFVERLAATASHPGECLAPDWSRQRWAPHDKIKELLLKHNVRQGKTCSLLSSL